MFPVCFIFLIYIYLNSATAIIAIEKKKKEYINQKYCGIKMQGPKKQILGTMEATIPYAVLTAYRIGVSMVPNT